MIRTTFSFLALCTSLFVASRLIHQSLAAEKLRPRVEFKHGWRPHSGPAVFAFELDVTDATSHVATQFSGPRNQANGGQSKNASQAEQSHRETQSHKETQSCGETQPDQTARSAERALSEKPVLSNESTKETAASGAVSAEKSADSARIPRELDPAAQGPPESAVIPPLSPAVELTPELTKLREDVRDCLGFYYNRLENVVDHSPWGIMHVLIAYGVDTQVIANDRSINAIGWLCWNGTCRGQRLFEMNNGRLQTQLGPGVQGHDGQFLAMMAQSRVQTSYPMRVAGQDLTIADLIEHEKRTCHAGTELTFKLIGLAHYLASDAEWRNVDGENWSISRLIKEELAQHVIGAACGGTHRMMGFTYAVQKREKEGKPLTGQWKRAKTFLDDYFEYTFYLQNGDGSFSTDFFRGRNDYGDINRRIETTGHILEWFVASLPSDKLRDPRVVKTVGYLARLMLDNRGNAWEIGPKGHALHALAIYSERVFGDRPGQRDAVLARGRQNQLIIHQR